MNLEKYKGYAPILLRITVSLVFLWFGLNQLFNASNWLGWLPSFAYSLPIKPIYLILFNGAFETVFGILLIVGLFTRLSSLLLSLHLLGIAFSLGYNDVAIRDFGLALATLSIFLNGHDKCCLDSKRK